MTENRVIREMRAIKMPGNDMKKLPIGIQTFRVIRDENYCYVDKTPLIARLVDEGRYYFLSRPRRFGKSLLVDTLAEAFAGTKDLFSGLYLEDNWDWEKSHPVIRLDFGAGVLRSRDELDRSIREQLSAHAEEHKVILKDYVDIHLLFGALINALSTKKGRVVILVDEYDKPILDNITEPEIAREMREGLKNIYSVIKSRDACLRFVLLTGVSKFSKVSIFSGLNNLVDITLDRRYATLCGYTEADLDVVFGKHLEGVDRAELRRWYNGYNFLGEPVYNPFDILLFLRNHEFRNYWFESGTPGFLVELLKERRFYLPEMETLEAGEELLGSFDVDHIEPEALFFQTGYVTILERRRFGVLYKYYLGYPNLEVKMSMTRALLNAYTPDQQGKERLQNRLFMALEKNDIAAIEGIFHAFFASIPHDWYRKNDIAAYEGYYASVVYCYFAALGLDVTPEDTTNKGRIDMSVRFAGRVYLFEFKVNEIGGPGAAMAQLKARKYHEKFMKPDVSGTVPEIFLIAVEFSRDERNVTDFAWEKIA